MPKKSIPYSKTGYFSKLICDYLAENESLHSFYHRFPKIENFKLQLEEKKDRYSMDSRRVLVERLKIQYEGFEISEATNLNIEALLEPRTFTITTGHQLNLFTGPLYFLYKIFSVINLVEKLNKKYADHQFVPVYWMATEDHDLDEINYFNLFGEKIIWDKEAGGAVGELSNDGLEEVLNTFKAALGDTENAKKLGGLFEDAYTKHSNLAEATRYLGNQLFSEYGLVIIDGNDPILKKAFIPYVQKELNENLSFRKISDTTARIVALGYKAQVHPREINLFYLNKGIRERLIEQEGSYLVNGTERIFTSAEISAELLDHPERFSPNALLRPLYQEVILPNLCYIGGGGELADTLFQQGFNLLVLFCCVQLQNIFQLVHTFDCCAADPCVLIVAGNLEQAANEFGVLLGSDGFKANIGILVLPFRLENMLLPVHIRFSSQRPGH